jgi:hypothetical protein
MRELSRGIGLVLMDGVGGAALRTSLQLTAPALQSGAWLQIGAEYQQRTTFHRLRPNGL